MGSSPTEHPPSSGRRETPEERADRLWVELLQEVRVTQTAGQILLAFLLSVAFTPRFAQLSAFERGLYVTTIVLAAAATGALVAPVSFHRITSGHHLKPEAVAWASRFTLLGLILLLATVGCALLLILRVVLAGLLAAWLVAAVVAWFLVCWFLPPLWIRHRDRRSR
jgi:hypothetical protein